MSDFTKLKQTVAVIGYGSQGHAVALNLQDSGVDVVVGLAEKSSSRTRATDDGIKRIESVSAAVQQAGIIVFAFPDHLHGETYRHEIRGRLRPGCTLVFLHGLSVHFGLVEPPDDVDVIMIAPHGPGVALRANYTSGDRTMSAFRAVQQDVSGDAEAVLSALAEGIGISPERLVHTTFEQEAIGDMFGEQAVLCGGMTALIKAGFDTLVRNGISPENAYLEVAYQLDLIIGLIKQHGISGMYDRISLTARYGSAETGPELVDEGVRDRMQRVYDRVASGEFVSRLSKLRDEDIAKMQSALRRLTDPALEAAAKKFAK